MNDIEILEKYVKLLDDTITKRAIENLLIENKELNYGYDKVYKELEKCKNKRQEDKDRIKELEETDLTTVYIKGFNDAEEKWKNKIKNKMEELNKKTKNVDVTEAIFMIKQQQVLDSVLKESD